MSAERRDRILERLSRDADRGSETRRLCQACADVTEMSGAGIMLMSGELPRGSLCTSGTVSALIEQLQYELGEGPCVDAYQRDEPVLEPDLVRPNRVRWPAFSGPAIEAGVRAVFGFPLRVGSVRLGALNLHRLGRGELTDDQHADALVMADIAARAVLTMQADAPPGALATEIEAGADFQYVVHQASGMVAAQLGVSVGHALVRIRAYAFGNDRPLAEVARDIVARRLRLDDRDAEA